MTTPDGAAPPKPLTVGDVDWKVGMRAEIGTVLWTSNRWAYPAIGWCEVAELSLIDATPIRAKCPDGVLLWVCKNRLVLQLEGQRVEAPKTTVSDSGDTATRESADEATETGRGATRSPVAETTISHQSEATISARRYSCARCGTNAAPQPCQLCPSCEEATRCALCGVPASKYTWLQLRGKENDLACRDCLSARYAQHKPQRPPPSEPSRPHVWEMSDSPDPLIGD